MPECGRPHTFPFAPTPHPTKPTGGGVGLGGLGEATLGRARFHWKITEQWWDGPAHCVRYETAISGVDEVYFALERVYVDGSVDAVSMFGDRFPHEMLEDFNAALYAENTAVQSVEYNESWIHQLKSLRGTVSEKHCTRSHPNTYATEIRFVLRGVVFEDGKVLGDTEFQATLAQGRP